MAFQTGSGYMTAFTRFVQYSPMCIIRSDWVAGDRRHRRAAKFQAATVAEVGSALDEL